MNDISVNYPAGYDGEWGLKLVRILDNVPFWDRDDSVDRDNTIEGRGKRFSDYDKAIKYLRDCEYSKVDLVKFAIARGLHLINNERLYMMGGYTSISEYGKTALGYNNAAVSAFVRVGKRFICKYSAESIFASVQNPNVQMEDFGYFQLVELLRLKDDDIKYLLSVGRLTFNTSVQKIKELISDYKAEVEQEAKDAIEASYQTMDAAHEEFHAAYNALKQYLLDKGDDQAANVLLPRIMDQVVIIYREGRDR